MANPFFDDEGLKNAGHDDVDVPQTVERTVEDWESGTLGDGWVTNNLSGGSIGVQSSVVYSGNYAVQMTTTSGDPSVDLESYSGLSAYPQPGDTVQYKIYFNDTSRLIVKQAGVSIDMTVDGYLQVNDDSASWNTTGNTGEWLTLELELGTDGVVKATVEDSSSQELVSGSNTFDYNNQRIAIRALDGAGSSIFLDNIELERREPEARTKTQKGTTQLGNEVVPSGAINTGPQEVPPDHPNYPMVNLPVTDDLAQGEQVGYHLAINEEKALTVKAEADGNGGIQNKQITPNYPFSSLEAKRVSDDYHYAGEYDGTYPEDRLDNAVAAASEGARIYLEPVRYNQPFSYSLDALTLVGVGSGKRGTYLRGQTFTLSGVGTTITNVGLDGNGTLELGDTAHATHLTTEPNEAGRFNITVTGDNAVLTHLHDVTVTFQSGTANGIVDSSTLTVVTDNGANSVGDIT